MLGWVLEALLLKDPAKPPPGLSRKLLKKQDDRTSSMVIRILQHEEAFKKLAKAETGSILQRDAEDAEKLQAGIQISIDRGVIPADIEVEPITTVITTGKTADQVADQIFLTIQEAVKSGCVVVFQGLSGTGKGTTVAKLQERIGEKCVSWSNGNVFRALTLLAVKHCETIRKPFSADVLTAQLVADLMHRLSFGKIEGTERYDITIKGGGVNTTVNNIKDTLLKEKVIGTNIPTVANLTQGDVIKFAQAALDQLTQNGYTVLLEGREQTVNYIRTPYRFELQLEDTMVIGERRAAQLIMAQAWKNVQNDEKKKADYNAEVLEVLKSMQTE